MRKNPAREGKHRDRDDGSARERRAQSEQHRPAKCVVEARERSSGQSRVEQFHRRNGHRREQHRGAGKERRAPPTRCRRRRKRSVGRSVAAEPQTVQRDRAGDHGGDRDDQATRVVTRNIVVARMRDQVVGNDVDRAVRHHGRRGGSGDDQRDERAGNDGHWCAHSGPLPSPPRETRPFVPYVSQRSTAPGCLHGPRAVEVAVRSAK